MAADYHKAEANQHRSFNFKRGMLNTGICALPLFTFVLAVPDRKRNAAYFCDAWLLHCIEWTDASDWRLASEATVYHGYFDGMHIDDADALRKEFVKKGTLITDPLTDKP